MKKALVLFHQTRLINVKRTESVTVPQPRSDPKREGGRDPPGPPLRTRHVHGGRVGSEYPGAAMTPFFHSGWTTQPT